jgi:acetyl esterase/lipase
LDKLLKNFRKLREQGPARPTIKMQKKISIQLQMVDGVEVYRLAPKDDQASSKHIFYLHGGDYVLPITFLHWRFLQTLVERYGYIIIVPLYPLAPEAKCKIVISRMLSIYKLACFNARRHAMNVMGDSAGGGLAVALCYALTDIGSIQPTKLVLICPWMDVTLSNELISKTEKSDPMLCARGVRAAGMMYAGDLGTDHSYVSPINGDPVNLPPILIFAGTRDIVHHDTINFCEKMLALGGEIQLHIGRGMIHAWPIFPIPEAKQAMDKIACFL